MCAGELPSVGVEEMRIVEASCVCAGVACDGGELVVMEKRWGGGCQGVMYARESACRMR